MKTAFLLKAGLVIMTALTLSIPSFSKEKKDGKVPAKEFYVFDAINFRGKTPYMQEYGFSRLKLIYENSLVTDKVIDWKKVNDKIVECKQAGYKTIGINIETWYWSKSNVSPEELKCRLDSIFVAFRKAIPDCEIGNYGVPVDNLNVMRGWWPANLEKTEENVIARWLKSSEVREPAGAAADILMPCMYAYSPDMEQWIKDFNTMMDRMQKLYPGKKIYVYLWLQCYYAPDNPHYMEYLSPENMYIMLEECYKRADGAVIRTGSHSNMKNRILGHWDDKDFQNTFSGVLKFMKKYKIKAR